MIFKPRHTLKFYFFQQRIKSNNRTLKPRVLYRFSHETHRFFEVLKITWTDGSWILNFFFFFPKNRNQWFSNSGTPCKNWNLWYYSQNHIYIYIYTHPNTRCWTVIVWVSIIHGIYPLAMITHGYKVRNNYISSWCFF